MSTINLTVRIPEGLTEGQSFQVPTPSGETIIARVPAGYRGGMTINVAVPPSASAVAKPAAVAQPAAILAPLRNGRCAHTHFTHTLSYPIARLNLPLGSLSLVIIL